MYVLPQLEICYRITMGVFIGRDGGVATGQLQCCLTQL